MKKTRRYKYISIIGIMLFFSACKAPQIVERDANRTMPDTFAGSTDSTNLGKAKWKDYFKDQYLRALIDTALSNNQELNIMLQEIAISKNEVMAKKGEYMPSVNVGGGASLEKAARYTFQGSNEATTDIKPGRETPEPLPDFMVGVFANWEVDIWHKLRNARKAAVTRYLASVEGRNFMVTNIVAEIAGAYYELLALDNQLSIVQRNIEIQKNALEIVKYQKQAARATELAVRRFQAQVLNTQSMQYAIQQQIVETENKINFLVGRFPQHIDRDSEAFENFTAQTVLSGVPSQLLENRPDIRQAELALKAAKLDVQVARANFYPSLGLSASLGIQAFNPIYWVKLPESILSSLAADLMGPWINKRGIRATYNTANAKQIQAIYEYQRTVLNAFIEVANQVSNIRNLKLTYDLKEQEVQALTESIDIANDLFRATRADYMEVLLTQRDALESRFDLVETKAKQMNATVNIYRALGGGWH